MRIWHGAVRGLRVGWSLVTPAGRAAIGLAGFSLGLAVNGGWAEFWVLGLATTLVLLMGLVTVLLPRRAMVSLDLARGWVTVGDEAVAELRVRPLLLPMLNPLVQVLIGTKLSSFRLPVLLPGRTHQQQHVVPTRRRGVFDVGPVVNLQSDLLGLFARQRTWAAAGTLLVRPRTVALEPLAVGVIADLEGVPSDSISAGDLAFHALREYVPGDDLRHVHWRSSAKAGGLQVRQYQETRRAEATIVLDPSPSSYGSTHEFELAVSAACSVAIRALQDDFVVRVHCGSNVSVPSSVGDLLDASCRWRVERRGLAIDARRAALHAPGTSVVTVVSGANATLAELQRSAAYFPSDAVRLLLTTDPAGSSTITESGLVRVLHCARLEHLPALLHRGRS